MGTQTRNLLYKRRTARTKHSSNVKSIIEIKKDYQHCIYVIKKDDSTTVADKTFRSIIIGQ